MLLYEKTGFWRSLNPIEGGMLLAKNRKLLWMFIRRGVEARFRGAYLGWLWWFINPLAVLAVYVFVFAVVFESRFGGVVGESRFDYGLGVFAGLAVAQLVLDTLGGTSLVILQNSNYVKKVVFPLEILPVSVVGVSFMQSLTSLVMVSIAVGVFGPGLTVVILFLPFVLLPVLLMCFGLSWVLAAVGVFLRDLSHFVQFLCLVVMFFSAVFYSPDRIPEAFGWLKYNPLLQAVDMTRGILIWGRPPGLVGLGLLYLEGVVAFAFGRYFFERLRPAFSDVL